MILTVAAGILLAVVLLRAARALPFIVLVLLALYVIGRVVG